MGSRFLIIEDNPANLDLMRYLLQARGHRVESAMDGAEGVGVVAEGRPDLVICDLQIPGLDGFEVARALKADRRLREIPIVAVTAYAMVGDRDRVLARGFDGYLAKPINPRTFVDEVEAFLAAGAASGQEG